MKNTSAEVTAYIENAADFARPVLEKLRRLFHRACPAIEETIKWGVPAFQFNGLVGMMAAFKRHVSFGFWKAKLMTDPEGIFQSDPKGSMCAVQVTGVADLPADRVLLAYIKEAVKLNEDGVKLSRTATRGERMLDIPDYFMEALRKNPRALETFEGFSPSCKREYVEWVAEAKQEATRLRRMAQAVEMMAEGKSRNWKYL
jgi:uncharacterized protein YdeI (YjbR/CyaY-like superfamily)